MFILRNMNYAEYASKQIKARRIKAKISLPALAGQAKISKGNLSKIENKASNLSVETLGSLADALKVSARMLVKPNAK